MDIKSYLLFKRNNPLYLKYLKGGSKKLPDGYIKVDYIESNGTQYIDTGYLPNNNTKVDIKFMGLNNTANVTPLFGGRTSAETETYTTFYKVGSKGRVDYGRYSPSAPTIGFIEGRIHTFVKDKEKNYLDGEYVNSNAPIEFACIYPLYINSINTAGTPSATGLKGKLYYTKIYDDNNLVRDLVPAVKKGSKNLFSATLQEGYYGDSDISYKTLTTDDRYRAFELQLKAGTYTINISADEGIRLLRCSNDIDKAVFVRTDNEPYTFVLTTDTTIYISFRNLNTTNSFTNLKIMLNEGTEALPYEEYSPEQVGMYDLSAKSKNLLNRATCVENKLLTWASGTPYDETGSLVTDFMEVKIGDKFVSNYRYQKMFYDKDKNYLGALCTDGTLKVNRADIANTTTNFIVPNISDIAYVRLGYRKSLNSNTDMTTVDVMFNEGETALPYEPYQKRFYTNEGTGEFGYEYNGEKKDPTSVTRLKSSALSLDNTLSTDEIEPINKEFSFEEEPIELDIKQDPIELDTEKQLAESDVKKEPTELTIEEQPNEYEGF